MQKKKKTADQRRAERMAKNKARKDAELEKKRNAHRLEYPLDIRIYVSERLQKEEEAETESEPEA